MEEYSFLEEYGLEDDGGMMESQAWSTGDDNGMGDEMEAAFEEFLRPIIILHIVLILSLMRFLRNRLINFLNCLKVFQK